MVNFVRAFVIALALTGATAFLQTANAVAPVSHPKPGSLPVPMCPPSDPNGCGIGNHK